MEKPHYERKEQIMCAVEGELTIQLVPHVNRQEVYAGESLEGSSYDEFPQFKGDKRTIEHEL